MTRSLFTPLRGRPDFVRGMIVTIASPTAKRY